MFLSGLAKYTKSFWLLLIARGLSGVGEASFQCIAPPFIDDYAPDAEKVKWLSIFFIPIPVGSALGYVYGAALATGPLGWAWAFWIEGACMVPFIWICTILPYRLKMDGAAAVASAAGGDESNAAGQGNKAAFSLAKLTEEARVIFSSRLFCCCAFGYASYTGVTMGIATFGPTLLQGLKYYTTEAGASFAFGAILAAAGLIGTPVGGILVDRAVERLLPLQQTQTACAR